MWNKSGGSVVPARWKKAAPGVWRPRPLHGITPFIIRVGTPLLEGPDSQLAFYAAILAGGLVSAMINTATATTTEPTMKGM